LGPHWLSSFSCRVIFLLYPLPPRLYSWLPFSLTTIRVLFFCPCLDIVLFHSLYRWLATFLAINPFISLMMLVLLSPPNPRDTLKIFHCCYPLTPPSVLALAFLTPFALSPLTYQPSWHKFSLHVSCSDNRFTEGSGFNVAFPPPGETYLIAHVPFSSSHGPSFFWDIFLFLRILESFFFFYFRHLSPISLFSPTFFSFGCFPPSSTHDCPFFSILMRFYPFPLSRKVDLCCLTIVSSLVLGYPCPKQPPLQIPFLTEGFSIVPAPLPLTLFFSPLVWI